MEKEEFLAKYRALILRYYPDRCDDEELREQHAEITVKLNAAYEAFKKNARFESRDNTAGSPEGGPGASRGEVLVLDNQDYIYYKLGIEYYRKHHPSSWSKYFILLSRFDSENGEYARKIKVIEEIFKNLNLALLCFRKVANDFPSSPWAYSLEKIKFLNKMVKTHEAIWKNTGEGEYSADVAYFMKRKKPKLR